MASIPTHSLIGWLIGRAWALGPRSARFHFYSLACAALPDLDVIGFPLGIRYEDALGHRGFSHSLCFAVLVGVAVGAWVGRHSPRSLAFWGLALHFTAVTASHAVLDMMTDGGLGVAFWSPFDLTRYFLPWRPLVVSPIGVTRFLSEWGWRVVQSEALYAIVPALFLSYAVRAVLRRARAQR